jgi:hypothetical protein
MKISFQFCLKVLKSEIQKLIFKCGNVCGCCVFVWCAVVCVQEPGLSCDCILFDRDSSTR